MSQGYVDLIATTWFALGFLTGCAWCAFLVRVGRPPTGANGNYRLAYGRRGDLPSAPNPTGRLIPPTGGSGTAPPVILLTHAEG